MVNAAATISVLNSSRTAGRISSIPDFGTLSMTRFYPSAASVVPRSDLGPTKQAWLSLDLTDSLIFDTAEGVYIDPETEFETENPDVNISSPSMVFPSGAVAQLNRQFEDRELSTGEMISRLTTDTTLLEQVAGDRVHDAAACAGRRALRGPILGQAASEPASLKAESGRSCAWSTRASSRATSIATL